MRQGKAAARPLAEAQGAPGIEVAEVIVVPDVEHDVVGGVRCFDLAHAAIGLVDAIAADAVVFDRLAQMRGEILLPGLAVGNLVAVGEAIAVGVDARGLVGGVDSAAGAGRLVVVKSLGVVDAVGTDRVDEDPAELAVVGPAEPFGVVGIGVVELEEGVDFLAGFDVLLQIGAGVH